MLGDSAGVEFDVSCSRSGSPYTPRREGGVRGVTILLYDVSLRVGCAAVRL